MIFDVGYRRPAHQHVNRAGMAEAVGRVQVLQAVFRKRFFQMVLTNAVNSAPRRSLAALIDEQTVFECRHRIFPVFL